MTFYTGYIVVLLWVGKVGNRGKIGLFLAAPSFFSIKAFLVLR
jgi:hypothetical protein